MASGRSIRRLAVPFAAVLFVIGVVTTARPEAGQDSDSDLDDFMAQVLARREESWRTLRQYILDERETIQLHGPGQMLLYGSRRDYTWFPRESVFVRSPVRVNGVAIDEAARRRAEDDWLRQEARREARRDDPDAPAGDVEPAADGSAADVLPESLEPRFVSSAYFLRFRFDPGQYALVGREQLDGREVLRVEYYPTSLFREDRDRERSRGRQERDRERERDANITAAMNKTSLVTLWIAPEARQIVQYEFENVDMDFLPGRAFIRIDELRASMRMGEPFPGVWLPQSIAMRFAMLTALGPVTARYGTEYYDYRLAEVTTRIR